MTRKPHSVGARLAALLFAALFLALFHRISGAAEWSVEPSASLQEEVNDNIRMTPGPHRTVRGTRFSPEMKIGVETERMRIEGYLLMNVNRYSGEEGLDATDYFFSFPSRLHLTERDTLKGEASYRLDSTLQSELIETGRVLDRRQRRLGTLSPAWTRAITARASLEGGYRLTDARYEGNGAGLFDYQTHTGTVRFLYHLSEKDRIGVTGSYARYSAPSIRFRSDDAGVRAEATHLFSETVKGVFSAGAHRTVSAARLQEISRDREWGWVVRGDLEKEWESTSFHSGLSRDIQPSGSGALVEVDHLSVSVARRWSPVVTLSLGADAYRSRPLRDDAAGSKSRYYRIQSGWRWLWAERWSLDASYSYSGQKYEQAPKGAVSNAAHLKVSYHGAKWSVSR